MLIPSYCCKVVDTVSIDWLCMGNRTRITTTRIQLFLLMLHNVFGLYKRTLVYRMSIEVLQAFFYHQLQLMLFTRGTRAGRSVEGRKTATTDGVQSLHCFGGEETDLRRTPKCPRSLTPLLSAGEVKSGRGGLELDETLRKWLAVCRHAWSGRTSRGANTAGRILCLVMAFSRLVRRRRLAHLERERLHVLSCSRLDAACIAASAFLQLQGEAGFVCRCQGGRRASQAVHDGPVQYKRAQVRCLEMARGALGLLVDDFLYTYDPATLDAKLMLLVCTLCSSSVSTCVACLCICVDTGCSVLDMLCTCFVEKGSPGRYTAKSPAA